MPAYQSPTVSPANPPAPSGVFLDTDAVVSASVLDALTAVTRERAAKLEQGESLRDINDAFVEEYSRFVATVTQDDEATVHAQVSESLARSGKEASATLLQLVVGARVYQSLGLTPTAGVFAAVGSAE